MPDLDGSPERLTWTSAGTSRRRAADSESSEWTRAADPVHDLHLVRLEMADEVPREGVAVLGMLRIEILRPVLTHDGDAGLEELRHVGE